MWPSWLASILLSDFFFKTACASFHRFAKLAVHYTLTACLERSKEKAQETGSLCLKKSVGFNTYSVTALCRLFLGVQ